MLKTIEFDLINELHLTPGGMQLNGSYKVWTLIDIINIQHLTLHKLELDIVWIEH